MNPTLMAPIGEISHLPDGAVRQNGRRHGDIEGTVPRMSNVVR